MLAVAIAAAVVLRDVVTYDRPPAPPAPPPPTRAAVVAAPAPEPAHDDGSILSGLTAVEHDETSPLRRVAAAVVLLTLTLVAAGLVGAGIYRAVSGLK